MPRVVPDKLREVEERERERMVQAGAEVDAT
jgi:hypothetical protein